MPTRSNACSELTRFWLEVRHGCLTNESVPAAVRFASSDIDLAAFHPRLERLPLPGGRHVGPRLVVETKDEHDWDSSGGEFGACLRADVSKMGDLPYIPKDAKGVKFTMLRQQHYEKAIELFATDDFDRLFVVHALDNRVRAELGSRLAERWRIHWVTIPELVCDLAKWYKDLSHPATLRNTLVGDLLHLLWGFCQFSAPAPRSQSG